MVRIIHCSALLSRTVATTVSELQMMKCYWRCHLLHQCRRYSIRQVPVYCEPPAAPEGTSTVSAATTDLAESTSIGSTTRMPAAAIQEGASGGPAFAAQEAMAGGALPLEVLVYILLGWCFLLTAMVCVNYARTRCHQRRRARGSPLPPPDHRISRRHSPSRVPMGGHGYQGDYCTT